MNVYMHYSIHNMLYIYELGNLKGEDSQQLYYHNCSGTESQATPQGCHK